MIPYAISLQKEFGYQVYRLTPPIDRWIYHRPAPVPNHEDYRRLVRLRYASPEKAGDMTLRERVPGLSVGIGPYRERFAPTSRKQKDQLKELGYMLLTQEEALNLWLQESLVFCDYQDKSGEGKFK